MRTSRSRSANSNRLRPGIPNGADDFMKTSLALRLVPIRPYDWFAVMCALIRQALKGRLQGLTVQEIREALLAAAHCYADHPPFEVIGYRVRVESLTESDLCNVRQVMSTWWSLDDIGGAALHDWMAEQVWSASQMSKNLF